MNDTRQGLVSLIGLQTIRITELTEALQRQETQIKCEQGYRAKALAAVRAITKGEIDAENQWFDEVNYEWRARRCPRKTNESESIDRPEPNRPHKNSGLGRNPRPVCSACNGSKVVPNPSEFGNIPCPRCIDKAEAFSRGLDVFPMVGAAQVWAVTN